jgi:hypothetical protein
LFLGQPLALKLALRVRRARPFGVEARMIRGF